MTEQERLKQIEEREKYALMRKQQNIEAAYANTVPYQIKRIETMTSISRDTVLKYASRACVHYEDVPVSLAIDILHSFFLAKWQDEHPEEK